MRVCGLRTLASFAALSIVAVMMVTALPSMASGQPVAHIGTWKLNPAKSTYDPPPSGPRPQSVTRTYEVFEGTGITYTQVTVNADGTKTTGTYSAHFDGKDYPMKGVQAFDAIALKRVDGNTFTSELKKGGKVVGTVRNVISADGKTMTATNTGTNAEGKPTKSVVVYERQ